MRKFIAIILLFLGVIIIPNKYDESNLIIQNNDYLENLNTSKNITEVSHDVPIFTYSNIPDNIYKKMLGNSIPFEYKNKVDISNLSYLKISYYGFDNTTHVGEMIVNSKVSSEVLDIFRELYNIKYPIEKIKLIDEYGANDELSMSDNNTSCFCYRVVAETNVLSNHSSRICNRY